jgi:DNA transformation protein
MSYYEIPDRLYDDPDELAAWARKACNVALQAASSKRRNARVQKPRVAESKTPSKSKRAPSRRR